MTTLAGSQTRNNTQSVFLVDGRFKEGNELQTALYSVQDIPVKDALEYWKVTIPEDGDAQHQLRYLASADQKNPVVIYVKNGDKWEKQETDMMGSYQLFKVNGSDAEIVVAAAATNYMVYMIIATAVIVIVILATFIIIHKRKKK